jgi:hypothetical protein
MEREHIIGWDSSERGRACQLEESGRGTCRLARVERAREERLGERLGVRGGEMGREDPARVDSDSQ